VSGTGAALALVEEEAEVMSRIVRVARRIAAAEALPLGEAGHRQSRAKAPPPRIDAHPLSPATKDPAMPAQRHPFGPPTGPHRPPQQDQPL